MVAIEEIFSYQFSFADIEADKYIEYRRSHADPRIHAMDRLTDDVVDELVKLLALLPQEERARSSGWTSVHAIGDDGPPPPPADFSQLFGPPNGGVPDEQRSRAALLSSAFWANHRF